MGHDRFLPGLRLGRAVGERSLGQTAQPIRTVELWTVATAEGGVVSKGGTKRWADWPSAPTGRVTERHRASTYPATQHNQDIPNAMDELGWSA